MPITVLPRLLERHSAFVAKVALIAVVRSVPTAFNAERRVDASLEPSKAAALADLLMTQQVGVSAHIGKGLLTAFVLTTEMKRPDHLLSLHTGFQELRWLVAIRTVGVLLDPVLDAGPAEDHIAAMKTLNRILVLSRYCVADATGEKVFELMANFIIKNNSFLHFPPNF